VTAVVVKRNRDRPVGAWRDDDVVSRHRAPHAKTFVSGLESYSAWSVAQGTAALSLWPPNADRYVALRVLVEAVAELENDEGPTIDADVWRRWLGSRSSKKLRGFRRDGIHDEPLATDGVLRGRRYELLAGALESPGLQYRLLVDALRASEPVAQDEWLRGALQLLEAVALLSDRVIRLAGLGGYRWPDHSLERRIGVPEDDEYLSLCNALTLIPAAISDSPDLVDSLGPLVADGCDLRWKPLRRRDATGEWLVADPWGLTQAGLVRAYALVARSEHRTEIHQKLTRGALDVALKAARSMDWRIEQVDDSSVLASADTDCRALITVTAMPPETWDLGEPEVEIPAAIVDRLRDAAAEAHEQQAQLTLFTLLHDGRAVFAPRELNLFDGPDPPGFWMLSVTDLRLLGDALRRDPLALPAALESAPPSPWPENIDVVDIVGVVHRREATPPEQRQIPSDGTEHMHWKARFMSARHSVPAPDNDGWVEVYRWPGSPDDRMFTTADTEQFDLLVRMPGRSIWVKCADPAAEPHDLEGFISQILALWLSRMADRGFPELPEPVGHEIAVRVDVEFSELPGPALAIRHTDHYATLVVGPAFVHALCRGDNLADRMLIAAVLDAVPDRGVEARREFVDVIAPAGNATAGIWPFASLRSNPLVIEAPPLVLSRDRLAVGRELASIRLTQDQIAVLQGPASAPAVNELAAELERLLTARVAKLHPDSLLKLVELNEAAAVQNAGEEMGLPARAAISGADAHFGERESRGERNVALRALVERSAASPPRGDQRPGIRETGWLRAAAELQVRLGAANDLLLSGRAEARILVGPMLGIEIIVDGELPAATELFIEQVEEAAPDLMYEEYHDWWSTDPQEPTEMAVDQPIELEDPVWQKLDDAFLDHRGVRFEELLRLFKALSQIADRELKNVGVSRADELAARLADETRIDRSHVDAALSLATLGRTDYSGLDADDRPWRSNRERSYLREPLVDLGDGRLAWSSTHVLTASRYLYSLIEGGRLRSEDTLAKAVMKVSQQLDREFEDAVLLRVRNSGWQALPRVKKIGGVWLERQGRDGREQIGDIDVLAWHPGQRIVWLLDAKRLAPGLAADSMLGDALKLEASEAHQRERLQWVLAHREQVSQHLGIDCEDWRFERAIVINSPLVGAHLASVDLPIWTYRELPHRLAD